VRAYGDVIGKRFAIWGDKNNFHTHHLPELAELFPSARFLHIVRDGRDVACSYREVMALGSTSPYAPVLPVEIERIAAEWGANVDRAAEFMARLGAARGRTIPYERLVGEPEAAVRELCAWIGVEFEPRMLAFHLENRRLGLEPELTRDWKRRTLEPVSGEKVRRHDRELDAGERAAFERLAGAPLRRFGYL
jgi:hypothetical protein